MDPIGNVPLYVAALSRVEPARRYRVVIRELLIALVVVLLSVAVGRHVVRLLQLSDPALTISGGVILFLIALRMVFPLADGSGLGDAPDDGEPFIVPMAIPLVAGPSVLATVLFLVAREPGNMLKWLLAALAAWGGTAAILVLSAPIGNFLGRRGMIAMERLMGMVLTAIAVQMFLIGLASFLK
jgi:MarC family membrane protein